MKIRVVLFSLLVAGICLISGCGGESKELRKDAKDIADVMCKTIEAMKNLKTADPADTLLVHRLQGEYKLVDDQMAVLYREFRKKYSGKITTKEFNDQFRKYLSESMLNCKNLSKEDREAFEKGMR